MRWISGKGSWCQAWGPEFNPCSTWWKQRTDWLSNKLCPACTPTLNNKRSVIKRALLVGASTKENKLSEERTHKRKLLDVTARVNLENIARREISQVSCNRDRKHGREGLTINRCSVLFGMTKELPRRVLAAVPHWSVVTARVPHSKGLNGKCYVSVITEMQKKNLGWIFIMKNSKNIQS